MNVTIGKMSVTQASSLYDTGQTTKSFAVEWVVLYTSAIKRLNIVMGTPVHFDYLKSLEYIGYHAYTKIMHIMFDEFEMNELSWGWQMLRLGEPQDIYLFKGEVKQHIRVLQRRSFHREVWIYGLFLCTDKRYRLAPLKRDSDFAINIVHELKKHVKQARLPWL
jgi:hypothetical protein